MLRGPASPSEAEAEPDSDEESMGSDDEQVDCGKELRTQTVSALRFAVQVLASPNSANLGRRPILALLGWYIGTL